MENNLHQIRIQCLEHVPYETSGIIQYWAEVREHEFKRTLMYNNDSIPLTKNFDWLLVMGGPMSVNEEAKYGWLTKEKKLIEKAILEGKTVIGICLGGQLIADVLGARVHVSKAKEIGWHQVSLTPKAKEMELFKDVASEFMAFHWHNEMFDIPSRATAIASSTGCSNQGFIYKERVIGMQFHLELTNDSLHEMIEHHRGDIRDGKYVQTEREIVKNIQNTRACNNLIEELLNRINERSPKVIPPLEKKTKKKLI